MQFLRHILKIMRKLLTRFPIANTIASEILIFPIPGARSHQFHASYASDSLIFLILDARTTNFMLPMHRKLLFFSFSMPAPPISCFLCIGNSYFSHSRCPHHQFHASYASETLIFPILDARSTNFTLPMHRILLFFLFSMPVATNFTLPMHRILLFFSFSMLAPPISCFLCIGNSCFSYSRCPLHQFHTS